MTEHYVAQPNNKKEELDIDLLRLWSAILKRFFVIVLVAVLGGAASLAYTMYAVTPMYESSVMFYVNNAGPAGDPSGVLSSGDVVTSKYLVESYTVVLKTKGTMDEVIDYANSDRSYYEVAGMVRAQAVNETELLRVTVSSPDPQEAVKLVNAIAHVLPERVPQIINNSSAKVVEYGVLPTAPSSPSYSRNTVLGAVIAAVIVIGIIVLKELFDVSIKDEDDVERVCAYPILATVPDVSDAKKGQSRKSKAKQGNENWTDHIGAKAGFVAVEAYKLLRTKLEYSFVSGKDCRVLAVSSATPSEGKSFSAINLACSLAQLNKRVLLMDCDMRKPTLAEKMSLKKHPGLSDYLIGKMDFQDVCQRYESGSAKIQVVAAGHTPPNPLELLSSEKMAWTMENLEKHFDYIILDLPPVGEVSDALVTAKMTDGVLIVVRQNYCSRADLREAVQQFEFVGSKILGILMNGIESSGSRYGRKYGYGYRKRYGYRYGDSYKAAAEAQVMNVGAFTGNDGV